MTPTNGPSTPLNISHLSMLSLGSADGCVGYRERRPRREQLEGVQAGPCKTLPPRLRLDSKVIDPHIAKLPKRIERAMAQSADASRHVKTYSRGKFWRGGPFQFNEVGLPGCVIQSRETKRSNFIPPPNIPKFSQCA